MSGLPVVSIILPTYNRAAMLAEGLESIATQTFGDWELIVIDDGSTDRNCEVVAEFAERVSQPVKYIHQQNQGAGAARQRGVDESEGKLVAFMDSDDPWLSHHLLIAVEALSVNLDVDWVVGPARVIDERSGKVVCENSLYPASGRHHAWDLSAIERDGLRVVDGNGCLLHIITRGFPGCIPGSVVRRWVTEHARFPNRRVYEDFAFEVEAVASGARLGLFLEPHFVRRVHDSHTSLTSAAMGDVSKRREVAADGAAVFKDLMNCAGLGVQERRALRKRLADLLFWDLGYSALWQNGLRADAWDAFREGMRLNPLDLRMWKTAAAAWLRMRFAKPAA